MTTRKRPPGVVWIDWSGVTAVVSCERCTRVYGPWLDIDEAKAYAKEHREQHPGARLDADTYSDEPLIPYGGRPTLATSCTATGCTARPHARGLCMTHYQAERRERQAA
ncbi:hypothetical protein M2317_000059 [Microbacterium sp. ZKA21]|uniref:hypothetical protein n=1 Tax=Microbacterium sp. ZKA21 TaxID=3381694 RepID=UPI003D1D2679